MSSEWVMQMGSAEIGSGQIGMYADEAVTKEGIRKYLDVAARFPQMPWYNILLILKQMPEAEILCGIRAWKKYGAVLRQGENPVMLLSPVAVRGGDADGNRIGKELGMESVGVYDIAQVKLSVNAPMLEMPQLDVSLENALRERCGLVIMEDRDGSFLRSRAVKSCVSLEERTIYIRPGLSGGMRDVELMKCYARYVAGCVDVQENSSAAVQEIMGEYQDMAGDYLGYIFCRYFHLQEYPLRVIPGELFGETAERKGCFLRRLSVLVFESVQKLTGRKMLGFNETMFCNLFFTEPDRGEVLENLEQSAVTEKYADGFIAPDFISFRKDIGRKDKFSDEEIREIYGKRLARELFTFPPVIYGR